MHNISFVLGNGESRLKYNLEDLRQYGVIYGCNAIYRDFLPDVLIAVDEKMVKEIQSSNYSGKFVYRVPQTLNLKSNFGFEIRHKGYSCGPTAVWLSCEHHPSLEKIFCLGFDLYGVSGKVNNVYKDTKNYLNSKSSMVPHSNWIKQLLALYKKYSQKSFYRVGDVLDEVPEEWKEVDNVRFISYDEMFNLIK